MKECLKPEYVPEFPVKINFGIYGTADWDLVGVTVLEAYNRYATKWKIPADAAGFIAKQSVDGNHVLKSGEVLEFHRIFKPKSN